MYVSFIGTKLAKDVLVDANMLHRPLWKSQDAKQASLAYVSTPNSFFLYALPTAYHKLLRPSYNPGARHMLINSSVKL